jgi:hypothetical protein
MDKRKSLSMKDLLQVLGFAFLVLGLIHLLRAWGLINRESFIARYYKLFGCALLVSGAILFIISFFV